MSAGWSRFASRERRRTRGDSDAACGAAIHAYSMRTGDVGPSMGWARDGTFYGRSAPEPATRYRVLLGEWGWPSEAATYFDRPHYGVPGQEGPSQIGGTVGVELVRSLRRPRPTRPQPTRYRASASRCGRPALPSLGSTRLRGPPALCDTDLGVEPVAA